MQETNSNILFQRSAFWLLTPCFLPLPACVQTQQDTAGSSRWHAPLAGSAWGPWQVQRGPARSQAPQTKHLHPHGLQCITRLQVEAGDMVQVPFVLLDQVGSWWAAA
jgi:hypothetical protein